MLQSEQSFSQSWRFDLETPELGWPPELSHLRVREPGLYTSGKGTKTWGHSTLFSQATLEGRLSYDQLATNTIRGWGGGGIWAAHPITYYNSIPTMSQGQIQMQMIRWTKGTKKNPWSHGAYLNARRWTQQSVCQSACILYYNTLLTLTAHLWILNSWWALIPGGHNKEGKPLSLLMAASIHWANLIAGGGARAPLHHTVLLRWLVRGVAGED